MAAEDQVESDISDTRRCTVVRESWKLDSSPQTKPCEVTKFLQAVKEVRLECLSQSSHMIFKDFKIKYALPIF